MKLNDMTIADIEQAAAQNAEAYKHLVEKGHDVAWCGQSDPDDTVITDLTARMDIL